MTMTVRLVDENDYEAFSKLFEEAYSEYLESLKHENPQKYRMELKERYMRKVTRERFSFYLRAGSTFVAEEDGSVVGYVASQKTQFMHGVDNLLWIEYVVVKKPYRRHGIGQAMLRTLIDYAKHSGVDKIYTTINPDNQASMGLHLKSGFTVKDWKVASYKISRSSPN